MTHATTETWQLFQQCTVATHVSTKALHTHTERAPCTSVLAAWWCLGPLTQEEDEAHEEQGPPCTAQVELDNESCQGDPQNEAPYCHDNPGPRTLRRVHFRSIFGREGLVFQVVLVDLILGEGGGMEQGKGWG